MVDVQQTSDASEAPVVESKRARVRRLLIDPLVDLGFRFKQGMPDDKATTFLSRVADDLAYMSDDGLVALCVCLRTKGEGSAKCFWPAFATVLGFAEMFEHRPLIELPALLRWFKSAAGQAAHSRDRLVAEYWFWTKYKRPPVRDADKRMVSDKAAGLARRVELALDRQRRGADLEPAEQSFLDAYRARQSYLEQMISTSDESEFAA